MDFSIPKHVQDITHRVRQFVDEVVAPVEMELLQSNEELTYDRLQDLRSQAVVYTLSRIRIWFPLT